MKSGLKTLTLMLGLFTVLVACDQLEGVEPTIVSFKAQPSSIVLSETSTLSWTVLGGPEDLFVKLSPGDLELAKTGSVKVTPSETTEYTLSAGKSTKSLTVNVGTTTDGSDDGSDGGAEDGADDGTDGNDSGSDGGSDGHDSGSDDGADGGDGSDDGSDDGTDGGTDGTDGKDGYVQTAKLTASDIEPEDEFGLSLALSGKNAVIGSAAKGVTAGDSTGAAYFFERDASTWNEIGLELKFSGETSVSAVAISDSIAVTVFGCCSFMGVGDFLDIYKRSADGWESTVIERDDINKVANNASVSGNTVLLNSGSDFGGPLSVYELRNSGLVETAVLDIDEGGFTFGKSIALTQTFAAATDSTFFDKPDGQQTSKGSVYVFERLEKGWSEASELELTPGNGEFGEFRYGSEDNLAADGNVLLISGSFEGRNAVFVFERSEKGWSQTARLPGSSQGYYPENGRVRFDIGGDTIAVTTVDERLRGVGLVDIYQKTDQGWALAQILQSGNRGEVDSFGTSVAVSENTLMVGAPGDDGKAKDSGAVYVYKK